MRRALGSALVIAMAISTPATAAASAWTSTAPQQNFPGFNGVGAASTTDVWAVGESDADRELPYAEHWNGSAWTEIDPPLPAGSLPNGGVYGVTALSSSNAWTVGWTDRDTNDQSYWPLIDHWNGHTWRLMSAPGAADTWLVDVSALTPKNVWAVGWGASNMPLIEHYNGTAWKVVSAPGSGGLTSVRAVSASNIWAVGGDQVEHYNGKAWKLASYPGSSAGTISFGQINRVPGTTHLWAVGEDALSSTPVALHYTGSAWTSTSVPGTGKLDAVAASSDSDVWAAGTDASGTPITMHWNGSQWTQVSGTVLDGALVEAMTHSPNSSQLWAVGWTVADNITFAAHLR